MFSKKSEFLDMVAALLTFPLNNRTMQNNLGFAYFCTLFFFFFFTECVLCLKGTKQKDETRFWGQIYLGNWGIKNVNQIY